MLTAPHSSAVAKAMSSRQDVVGGAACNQLSVPAARLRTTLLSGFLGAGKTTLLKNILQNKENLRCAVIVNDMASINIDASLLKNSQLVQTEEKLVEMQNGCICCTLREDLLLEVSKLAKAGSFDHLVIESTGVSEPMQVAETFEMQVDEAGGQKYPPLNDLAVLDACITVIDASGLMANLQSIKTLKEQQNSGETVEQVDPEDERNIADLLVDQIEFADIILVNKVDLVSAKTAQSLAEFIKVLNPGARVMLTRECQVPLKAVLQVGAFSMEKAQQAPGWLRAMKEGVKPTPETEEYGIGSFVYRARQPFHPQRLYALLEDLFVIQQQVEEEHEHDHEHAYESADDTVMTDQEGVESAAQAPDSGDELDEADLLELQKNLQEKFGQVLRSKGFVWLADNEVMSGEWSQVGSILRLSCGGPWFAALPREAWNTAKGQDNEVLADFEGKWGDRRQELVFIGIGMKMDAITQALDSCLVAPEGNSMDSASESPFLPWPKQAELEEQEDSDGDTQASDEETGRGDGEEMQQEFAQTN